MTISLTCEDFEQAIKSGASVFEGNTILDTGKPSGRYYRFIRVPLANGEQEEIKKILPAVELVGQWSIDVMRNGDDYYIIDMALAENSALNDCVPREKLRAYPQQWLPMAANS